MIGTGPDDLRRQELTRLVQQYQTNLRRTCYAILRDEELAKDAVQETFLKAYRTMDAFRGACSEKTWLMHIAVNTCRDIRRSAWLRHIERPSRRRTCRSRSIRPATSASS